MEENISVECTQCNCIVEIEVFSEDCKEIECYECGDFFIVYRKDDSYET